MEIVQELSDRVRFGNMYGLWVSVVHPKPRKPYYVVHLHNRFIPSRDASYRVKDTGTAYELARLHVSQEK